MQEFPAIDKISRGFPDEKLAVLTINGNISTRKVKKAAERVKTSLPVLHDKGSDVFEAYRVNALPMLYLIDKEHKISEVWIDSIQGREKEVYESLNTVLESHVIFLPDG